MNRKVLLALPFCCINSRISWVPSSLWNLILTGSGGRFGGRPLISIKVLCFLGRLQSDDGGGHQSAISILPSQIGICHFVMITHTSPFYPARSYIYRYTIPTYCFLPLFARPFLCANPTLQPHHKIMSTLPDFLIEYMLNTKTVSYIDVSALALYVWDYFITIHMEIDLVWNDKWTLLKILFLLQRYLPFVDVVVLTPYRTLGINFSTTFCYQFYHALAWMMFSGTILSEALLAFRVWAVWGRAKWPTIILALSSVAFWAPAYLYLYRFLKPLRFVDPLFPGYHGCTLISAKNSLLPCYLMIMIWNIGTLIFMLIPGLRSYRAGGNSALFHIVYRDGVMYYLYLVVLSLLNVLAFKTFPIGAEYMLLSVQRCLHTILASRMLLHIRNHVKNEMVEVQSEPLAVNPLNFNATLNTNTNNNINFYDIRVVRAQAYDRHEARCQNHSDERNLNEDVEGRFRVVTPPIPYGW